MSDEILRLIGDGDRASGGAIPLPDAFVAVVEQLLDHGTASFAKLNDVVSEALSWKETRILSAGWRAWEDFTRDILKRLVAIGAVETLDDKYRLAGGIKMNDRVEPFPGRSDIYFVVRDKDTREQFEDNSRALNKIRPVLHELRGYTQMDPWALKHVIEAEDILRNDLAIQKNEVHKTSKGKVSGGRPLIRRGDPQWRQLTGTDLPAPTKAYTADYVMKLAAGDTFTESKVTAWVGAKVKELEGEVPELVDLSPVGSSTVAQALHGKDGKGGLVGDGLIEKLPPSPGRENITYRKL